MFSRIFAFCIFAFSLSAQGRFMQDTGRYPPIPYLRFDLPNEILSIITRFLPADPVIVDAGAFDGQESLQMATLWPKGTVYSFEPIPQLFEKVVQRARTVSNMKPFKYALGNKCGKEVMYLSNEGDPNIVSMSSSLYEPKDHLIYSGTQFGGIETVDVTTLDQWAFDNHINHVDMLWLDMQGFELPALKASPNVLSQVSIIITELEFVEAYQGQPLYREVKSWLENQGFVLCGGNFSFPKNPKQWFGDGLFIRKELLRK